MALLTLDKVSVQRPEHGLVKPGKHTHLLVDQVSFQLDQGDVMAIIGPNGAGKSTLLKAMSGDLPYTGNMTLLGAASDPKLRARQVAVLPQLSLLNFPYRVSEVVGLSRIPHQTGLRRDIEIVEQALELMDIDYLSNRLYTELSGGEKQRVQLARVLAQIWDPADAPNKTRLLLLDEPTVALDLGHQKQLMHAIRTFAEQGVAVVMVLHDVNLAAAYADQILALICSQQIAVGSPNTVITPQNLQTLFAIDATVIRHPEHDTPVVIGL